MKYEQFYQSAATLNSNYLWVVCRRGASLSLLKCTSYRKVCVCIQFSRLQRFSHLYVFKGFTDKKFKLFHGNVNYKNTIYYILLVFIKLTYSVKNVSPHLKPLV